MSSVLLIIKIDPNTKNQLKDFAAELGVSSTAFVNMVVKQALRERRVVLDTNLKPTPYLEKIMRKAEADLVVNRNIITTKTKEEALEHLRSL